MKLSKWSVPAVFLLGAQVAIAQQVYLDTFGNSAVRKSSPFVPQTTGGAGATSFYKFADPAINTYPGHGIYDGSYAVVNPQNVRDTTVGGFRAGNWWSVGAPYDATAPNPLPGGFDVSEFYKNYKDHTGDNGAVLVVNAGNVVNDIYRFPVALQANKTYTVSAWILVDQGPTTTYFSVRDTNDTTQLIQGPDYNITTQTFIGGDKRNGVAWVKQPFAFTTPTSAACPNSSFQYGVTYVNKNPTAGGNDFFLDDIGVFQEAAVIPTAPVLPCSSGALPIVTANPDVSYTTQGVPVATSVLTNDVVDTAGLTLTLSPTSVVAQPAHGTAAVDPTTGIITYTPAPGYTGTDIYTYRVCTKTPPVFPNAVCNPIPTVVTIHVLGAVANNDSGQGVAGSGPIAIPVTTNDSASDPAVPLNPASVAYPATGAVTPANGNVSFSNGVANYTPNPGFVGVNTFNYQVCTATPSAPYPQPACAVATVTVTVTPLIVPKPDSGSATSGTASTPVSNVAVGDVVNGQPATLGATGNATVAPIGTWPQGITLNPATGEVNVPATAQPGIYTMDYTLCDKSAPKPNCLNTTVTITVSPVNNGGGAGPTAVPTMGQWALTGMSLILGLFAAMGIRRRRDS